MGGKAQIELKVLGMAELAEAAKGVDNVGKALGKTGEIAKSFAGGAGLGKFAAATTLTGLAALAGGIIMQSMRMASEFERLSQRTVFTLTANSDALAANLEKFKATAKSLSYYGIGGVEGAKMGAAYGMTAGALPGSTIGQMRSLAAWSTAFGMDHVAFGQGMGAVSQFTGGNIDRDSSIMFGGASQSGQAGRRPAELLATAAQALQSMASSRPFQALEMKDAMREIVGITRLGGVYQTSYGLQTTLGAELSLGANKMSNPVNARLAARAGWSMLDIVTGSNDPKKLASYYNQLYGVYGKNPVALSLMLRNQGLGDDPIRLLMGKMYKDHGQMNASDVRAVSAAQRDAIYGKTPTGEIEKAGAEIQNVGLTLGDAILKGLAPKIETLSRGVEKLAGDLEHGTGFMGDLSSMLDGHFGIIEALLAAQAIGKGANFVKWLVRGGGAAAAGAEGAAGAGAGWGMAAVASVAGLLFGAHTLAKQGVSLSDSTAMNYGYWQGPTSGGLSKSESAALRSHWTDIVKASKRHGVDPALVAAVMWRETDFGLSSLYRNGRGDGGHGYGLMQLDDGKRWGHPRSKWLLDRVRRDPAFAIDYGAGMLANNISSEHGDEWAGVRDYNGSGSAAREYAGDVVASRLPAIQKQIQIDGYSLEVKVVRKPSNTRGGTSRSRTYNK